MLRLTHGMAWKVLVANLTVATIAIVLFATQATARTYKGDLTSRTLVFDVTTSVDGQKVEVQTWFAQWVGNVYAKSIESSLPGVGPRDRGKTVCETASWIAPQRHIWKEGDEPYLTQTEQLKFLRLDHSIRKVRCRRATDETKRVSKGATKRAQDWFVSRHMTSRTVARDHHEIANVESWMAQNVPGFVSIALRNDPAKLTD